MKFHLQDVHCIKLTKGIKRRRSGSEVEFEPVRRGTLTPPSVSSEYSSPSNTSATDESIGAAETPASSVYPNLFDKLNPRLYDE